MGTGKAWLFAELKGDLFDISGKKGMWGLSVDLRFSVHEAFAKFMVTVINESSGEIIMELPSSEILDIAAKVDNMRGLIFDQKG